MRIKIRSIPPPRVRYAPVWVDGLALVAGLTEAGAVCRIGFLDGRSLRGLVNAWRRLWPQTAFEEEETPFPEDLRALPVLLVGTPFQGAVWRALSRIPAGRTVTYGDLAARLGKPGAARAVGRACGANPVPVLIPCHRVVSRENLGGFSAGVRHKEFLLRQEGVFLA